MKFLWIFQEVHDLFDFFFGLIATRHVSKRHGIVVLVEHACFAFAKAECAAFAAALHLTHEVHPHANQQQHGAPANQQGHQERAFFTGLDIKLHAVGNQVTDQAAIQVGGCRAQFALVIGDGNNFCTASTFLDGGCFDALGTNFF